MGIYPILIIVKHRVNHSCDRDNEYKMIGVASASQVDVTKLQTSRSKNLVENCTPKALN